MLLPHFAACHGEGCHLRDICYRHRVLPLKDQAQMEPPTGTEECEEFLPIRSSDILRPMGSPWGWPWPEGASSTTLADIS